MHGTQGFRAEHPGLQHAPTLQHGEGAIEHLVTLFLQQQLGFLISQQSLCGKQPNKVKLLNKMNYS